MRSHLNTIFIVTLTSLIVTHAANAAVVLSGQRQGIVKPQTIGEAATQTNFAKAIEDLPLMPGLSLVEENDLIFLFGSNRIVQTTTKGHVDIDSVYYFYQSTLPELGWKQINARLYQRGGELLKVDASSANEEGMTYVRFEVTPE